MVTGSTRCIAKRDILAIIVMALVNGSVFASPLFEIWSKAFNVKA